MLKYLLEKEFKQILRNPFLPKMIIAAPCMMLLVLPWAANFEVKNINLSLVDSDHSRTSFQLVQEVIASGYFRLTDVSSDYDRALGSIENDKADVILEIPAHFEVDLMREQAAKLMISANTVNSTKGNLGSSYLAGIVNEFSSRQRIKWPQTRGGTSFPMIQVLSQDWFNPHLSYKVFMVPALMVMLLTMICGFLPALNIVGEKEAGTMEQINVTPITKLTFVVSKLLPYWIIGFIVISIGFVLAYLIYGLAPSGHLSTIYLFAAIYILGVSGLGLVVSNYSDTMQQAMFVAYFFMMILIFMSGLFTPVASMPRWAQWISAVNPLKYFMEVMRLVYLKGSGVTDLGVQLVALTGFGVLFNLWAVLSYRKSK